MKDSLKDYIEKYETNLMCSKSTIEILADIRNNLRKKIEDSFPGEDKIFAILQQKTKYTFKLEYFDPSKKQILLPDIVSYGETSKNFNIAINILTDYYFNKIEQFDSQTINMFTNNDSEKRKNYIKKGMGLQLMNKDVLFKKEIQNIRTIQDAALNIEGGEYTLSDIQRIQDSKEFEINEYAIEDLIDFKNNIEDQNKAFFWIPEELYKGIMLESKKAVYIAYFYSFLRKNSFAKNKAIAQETKVHDRGPSESWIPHHELERPFLVNMIDFMQPVFFSEESRKVVGLYDRKTRCYQGPYNNDKYTKIKKKKKILWDIYELLCNPDYIHDHIKLAGKNIISDLSIDNNSCLELELTMNEDIGLPCTCIKKQKVPYVILHIKSITII